MILTIESVCDESIKDFRKSNQNTKRFVDCALNVDYDNFSTIAASIVFCKNTLIKNPSASIFLPISFTRLRHSEYYEITIKLLRAFKLHKHAQVVICIDADEHLALFEHFETNRSPFFTLEEIIKLREEIKSSKKDYRIFSDNFYFEHLYHDDIYRRDAYRHLLV